MESQELDFVAGSLTVLIKARFVVTSLTRSGLMKNLTFLNIALGKLRIGAIVSPKSTDDYDPQ